MRTPPNIRHCHETSAAFRGCSKPVLAVVGISPATRRHLDERLGGTFRAYLTSEPGNPTPPVDVNESASAKIYNGLVRYDEQMKLVGDRRVVGSAE